MKAAPTSLSMPSAERGPAPIHVLLVDDDESLRRALARVLTGSGLRVDVVANAPAALEFLAANDPDVVLSDFEMPGMNGMELLAQVKALRPTLEVVIMTAFADVDLAVEAMRAGAYNFITKPFQSNDAVVLTVTKAAQHRQLADRARALEQRLASEDRFGELIGTSPKMREVYRLIEEVAPTASTVLILGESGTGKELVARALHDRSPRASKPFIAVNCGAISAEVVESELFGHVRGAFTGAHAPRAGLFESANGGTLFLDEVGDLPLAAQVKLLRALQEGEVKRVGSDETRKVDARVVAATNIDLTTRIEAGTFRRDLYYRLDVFAIALPPLRERGDDAALLASTLIRRIAKRIGRKEKGLADDAIAAIRAYSWPGNVRELENAMERACILARGDVVHAGDLPFRMSDASQLAPVSAPVSGPPSTARAMKTDDLIELPYTEAKKRALERFDDYYVREIVLRSNGNASEAARRAGVDRSNFRRILRRTSQ
jgi:DNA-binding NtrC family response regulator